MTTSTWTWTPSSTFTATESFTPTDTWTQTLTPSITDTPFPATWTPTATQSATPSQKAWGDGSVHPFVYPHPLVGGVGHLVIPLETGGEVVVRIYNSASVLVARFDETAGLGRLEMDLDMSAFAPGVYYGIVEVRSSSTVQRLKPVKIFNTGQH